MKTITVVVAIIDILLIVHHLPSTMQDIDIGFRIIGGHTTKIQQIPYMISITYHGEHHCGGSLIRSDVALSAAHCFAAVVRRPIAVRLYYRVRAGLSRLSDVGTGPPVQLEAVRNHPKFAAHSFDHDLAIVWLKSALALGTTVKPIALPGRSFRMPVADRVVEVSGWGSTINTGTPSDRLLTANVTMLPDLLCRHIYAELFTDTMICASNRAPIRDACAGDSGGPLAYRRRVLLGIVSWGNDCGSLTYPGVYTAVARMVPWIQCMVPGVRLLDHV